MKKLKKISKRLLSVFLALIMAITILPMGMLNASADAAAQNDYAVGDIVTFGSYPQTKVTNASVIAGLNSSTLAPDNTVIYGGNKYKKVYFTQYTPYHPDFAATAENSFQDNNGYLINTVYWFQYMPVQWRVLSNTDGVLFVLAETILDSRVYHQTKDSVTWETSTLRTWLNSDFYNNTFTIDEKSKILTTEVVNANNPWNTVVPGGNNTSDKLFLLSYAETVNTAYGFSSDYATYDTARRAQGSDYSKSCGLFVHVGAPYTGKSNWWLRSPGLSAVNAGFVSKSGESNTYTSAVVTHTGIRPVCRIRLTPVDYTAGEILEYGSYPQSEVTDANLITALNGCTLTDNIAVYGGARYKKVLFEHYSSIEGGFTDNTGYTYQDNNGYFKNTVYWFKFEPVEWRVLSSKNGNLFVMAEKALDARIYHTGVPALTWETSNTRAWLNNEFYNAAFTAEEKAMIKTAQVANPNNATYGTPGGNVTNDKLFLLSYTEVQNTAYGFTAGNSPDPARKAYGTDYSKSCGLMVFTGLPSNGSSFWWLRSPGETTADVGLVFDSGGFPNYGDIPNQACVGIRPAFKINLQSALFAPAEGSNCVIDHDNKLIYGLAEGLDSLNGYVSAADGYVVSYSGTLGTGAFVNLSVNGWVFENYKVILFGDVNGDGNIDSLDAGTMVDVENYAITWNPVSDAAIIKAADLNGDGNADSIDAGIAVDAENYVITIDQSTGLVV